MDYKKEYQVFKEAYGQNTQILVCIEEMGELTQAFSKYLRINENKDEYSEEKRQAVFDNMQEEIADVLNCIEQMRLMFGAEEIDAIRQQKIERTMKKLNSK